jgi:hypothetical protein
MHVTGWGLWIWIRYGIIDLKKLTSKHLVVIYDSSFLSHVSEHLCFKWKHDFSSFSRLNFIVNILEIFCLLCHID